MTDDELKAIKLVNPWFDARFADLSDKDYYLTFWGYKLGTPEAEEAWKVKCAHVERRAPMVAPDLPGYESPVSGKWIEGRAARREDLRRTGCRPYEEGERQEWKKQVAHEEKQLDRERHEAVARAFYAMPESKRRALRNAH